MSKTLVLSVTGRCNLKCSYCDLKFDKVDMSLDFIKNFDYTGVDYVILSGGEPTLHPQITEILDFFQKDVIIKGQIITNGYKIVEVLDHIGNFSINLSLSSVRGTTKKDKMTLDVLPKLEGQKLTFSMVYDENMVEENIEVLKFARTSGHSVTLNMPVQFEDGLETFYHKRVKFTDMLKLEYFCEKYKELYTDTWFIKPETLESFIRYVKNDRLWLCTGRELNQNIFVRPNGEYSNCCLTKNTKDCKGCLDICTLQFLKEKS